MKDRFGNFVGGYLSGRATGGSATTLVDATKDITANILSGKVLNFVVSGKQYIRKILSHTANTFTFSAIDTPIEASCKIAEGTAGEITVRAATAGAAANAFEIKIQAAPGTNDNLSASFSSPLLTIYLGKTAGELDNAKNTAVLVEAVIEQITEFTSEVTGLTPSTVIAVTTDNLHFAGGEDALAITAGVDYEIQNESTNATENPAPVELSGSNTRKWATDTITFGAGAGAHNAGEIMSTDTGEILEFDVSPWIAAGGSGIILSSLVTLDQAPFAGGAGYTLHLFTAAPTVIADDAAFVILAAELPSYIGNIDISTLVTGTNVAYALDVGHNLDFTLAAGSTKLYGQKVCKGTDTTVNTKIMTVNLGIAAL